MEKNDDSRARGSTSSPFSPNRKVEKIDGEKDADGASGGTQGKHNSHPGVINSNLDEAAHSQALHPQGIAVTSVGENVTGIPTGREDIDVESPQRVYSVATGENVATTNSGSAPVHPPNKLEVPSSHLKDESLDRILDGGKLLRDVKPKSSSSSASSGNSESTTSEQQSKTGEKVNLYEYFDFLAGTSTGAILTTMMITPDENGQPLFTAQECCKFYSHNGRNIFRPRWYDPFKGKMRQFYRPKYSAKRFERLLKSYLMRDGKALTMRDTLKPFLVTSFDISEATPHIFVRQAAMKDDSKNFRVLNHFRWGNLWEVCRGTAAAPTYFKPAEVTSIDGHFSGVLIDGGAIQNNPSLVATTHVLGNNEEFPEASSLSDLLILSLGPGQLDEKHEAEAARKWGMTGWVRPLLNIMMDGSSDTIDYQLASAFAGHSCSENYLRIQLSGLPNKTTVMDCTTKENIRDLINCTDELLQQKAVMRNAYGEKVTLKVTYAERLSWFADQLISQKKHRDDLGVSSHTVVRQYSDPSPGLGPTARLVSPVIRNLFMHEQTFNNSLTDQLPKAKSLRY